MQSQPGLFPEMETPAPSGYRRVPDPDKVRPRIVNFIAELRDASDMPWSPANLTLRLEIVPRMIGYLPEGERAALLRGFEVEIARLCPEREMPWKASA